MRRCIPVFVVALAVAVAAPSTSAATFDHHFSVTTKTIGTENTNNAFLFKEALLNPFDLTQRVGRDFGKCKFNRDSGKVRCKVFIHLDGTIGGFGNMLLKGNFGRGDNTLLVVNGTEDFNGVTGKVTVHNTGPRTDSVHFDLVR